MSSNDSSATSDVKVVNKALQGVKSTLLSTVSSADSAIRRLDYDKDLLGGVRRDHKYELSAKLEGTKRKLNQLRRMGIVEKYSGYLSLLFFHGVVVYIISKRLRLLLLLSTLWSATKHVFVPGKVTTTITQVANKPMETSEPPLVFTETSLVEKMSPDIVGVGVDGIARVAVHRCGDHISCHMESGQCISLLLRAYASGDDDYKCFQADMLSGSIPE